jgi:hypothetical protein
LYRRRWGSAGQNQHLPPFLFCAILEKTIGGFMNSSIVILKSGEQIICELKEAYEGEGEDKKGVCLVMIHPYVLQLVQVNNQDNPQQDLQVKFSRWCPYAVDSQFRIPYDSVVAIGSPDAGLEQAYVAKVEQVKQVNETENAKQQQEEINKAINPEVV